MTTQQIQCIITLAEEGSFSKAAKKILSTERELENRISDINKLKTGTLTIGTTPFRGSCLLPKSFAAFTRDFPGVKLDVITASVRELQALLLSGEIDICIEASEFDPELFHVEELATEHYYLAVGRENPFNERHKEQQLKDSDIVSDSSALYQNKEISLSDCLEESFIVLDTKNNDPDITVDLFHNMKHVPQITLRCYNIETMFHWVNSNLGMGIIPDTLIRFGNFKDHPVYYRLKEPKGCFGITEKKIVVAYSKKHFLTQTAPTYISLLKQLIGQGTWKF